MNVCGFSAVSLYLKQKGASCHQIDVPSN